MAERKSAQPFDEDRARNDSRTKTLKRYQVLLSHKSKICKDSMWRPRKRHARIKRRRRVKSMLPKRLKAPRGAGDDF
jgi:hypothetical protein